MLAVDLRILYHFMTFAAIGNAMTLHMIPMKLPNAITLSPTEFEPYFTPTPCTSK